MDLSIPIVSCLPPLFIERLQRIILPSLFEEVLLSFQRPDPVVFRINPLKSDVASVCEELRSSGFDPQPTSVPGAFYVTEDVRAKLVSHALVSQGHIYIQAFSSLLPAIVLAPQPGERVLDMCAAPGSKTTQIAALMSDSGRITALEVVRSRFFRLKSVCALMGTQNVECILKDARAFRSQELFDRILVDAPCSSEGRFKSFDKETVGYWSLRKIKEMSHKQKGLLMSASRLLRPRGRLVYSTCTFAPEENEEVIDWFLRKTGGSFSMEPVKINGVATYPALSSWGKRHFSEEVLKSSRILPTSIAGGFFIACLSKKK